MDTINKNKITRTITAYVPGNLCNFRCEYCYISKCVDESHLCKGEYKYSLDTMINAFAPERLGGIAAFVVIGSGETLIDEHVVPFIHGLLKQGHLVEVVTNLTLNNRIDELLDFPEEYLKRLIVKGSLHWNELKRLNKIDDYFNNMNKVLAKGASSYPFLVCGDTYIPHLEEIRQICLERINALPHCTPSIIFDEKSDISRNGNVKTSPACDSEFIKKIDNLFNSKIFDLSVKWLDIDPKELFCYAGKWSFCIDIGNGNLMKCHCCPADINFFEDITKMPELEAIGNNCQIASCSLQYNFIAQGIIPEFDTEDTYTDILGRENLFNEEVRKLLKFKYTDFYKQYDKKHQKKISDKIAWQYQTANLDLNMKNKIRLKIYNYLNKKLKSKGII